MRFLHTIGIYAIFGTLLVKMVLIGKNKESLSNVLHTQTMAIGQLQLLIFFFGKKDTICITKVLTKYPGKIVQTEQL